MATKKVLIEVSVREVGSKAVGSAATKAAKDLSKLTEAEQRARIEAEKLKITNAALAASFKQQAAAEIQAANAGKPLRAQAGLNNAILLETSRLASDAGYGFTAIANNLSQVISLFFSFSKTAGGVLSSLKQLAGSLLGAGGLLIGVQLLIAYGPKLLNWFKGVSEGAEKLRKEIDQLNEGLRDNSILVTNIIGDVGKYTRTQKDLYETTDLLASRFGDFAIGLENLKEKGLDKNDDAVRNLVKNFLRLNKVKQSLNTIEKTFQEQDKKGIVIGRERTALQEEYRRLLAELAELQEEFTKKQKKGGEETKKYKREFLRFTEEIYAARQALIRSLIDNKQDELALVGETEKQKLRIEFNGFIERQKQRLAEGRITQTMYYDSEVQAAEELQRALTAISNKTSALQSQAAIDDMVKANEMERVRMQERTRIALDGYLMSEKIEGNRIRKRLDLEQSLLLRNIEYKKQELNNENLTALEKAKIQAEITAMEKKESDIRVRINEAEQQAKVQTLEVTADALSAFGQLVGKETKAGKALAVSSALISTYLSAQKAYESQFMPLALVDSPVRGAIAAAAAVASGLANVKAILSEGKSKPSATTGRVQVEAPDFNVVGASPESQLAQTVAGQQARPLKAFVVGKEITSQQELDRNIETTASVGG